VPGSAAYSGSPSTRRIAGQESQKEDAMPFSVRRRDALGIAGILFLAAVLPASAEDLGVTFAKSLYKLPKLWGDVISTAAARQQYLASDLGAAIVENAKYSGDLDYAVDYDPLVQAQDWKLANIKFTAEKTSGDQETVRVDFKNQGEAVTVRLDLAKTAAGWRLADIHNSAGASLLQEYRDLNTAGRAVKAGN
jgi:Protein of unknown function (DUF3828)